MWHNFKLNICFVFRIYFICNFILFQINLYQPSAQPSPSTNIGQQSETSKPIKEITKNLKCFLFYLKVRVNVKSTN